MTVAAEYIKWFHLLEHPEDTQMEVSESPTELIEDPKSKASKMLQRYDERTEPEQLSMLTKEGKFRKSSRPQTKPGQGRRAQKRARPGREPEQMGLGFEAPPEQQRFHFGKPKGTGVPTDEPSMWTGTGRPSTQAFRAQAQQARRGAQGRPRGTVPPLGSGPAWAEGPRPSFGRRAADALARDDLRDRPATTVGVGRRLAKLYKTIAKSGPLVGLPTKGPERKQFDKAVKTELGRINKEHRSFLRDRKQVAKNIKKDGERRASQKEKEANKAAKDQLRKIRREGRAIKRKIKAQGKADAAEIRRITQRRSNLEYGRAKDAVRSEKERINQEVKDRIRDYGLGRRVLKYNPRSPTRFTGQKTLFTRRSRVPSMPPEVGEWEHV